MDVELGAVWKLSRSAEVRSEAEVFANHAGKSRMRP
jgi:hypothetical protein